MSRLALGCYPLGGGYGAVDENQARATVDAALQYGWTFIDTAETYLQSEDRLGQILRRRRNSVFLATKAFPCEPYTLENLEAALEGSLRRLQTDHVDLYQLHGPEDWVVKFSKKTPLEELADSLERLRRSGQALRIGVCNFPPADLDALASHTEIFSTQNLYSMIDRGTDGDPLHLPVEREIIPYCAERSIAFLAFSPLSRGLLADNLSPDRTFGPDDERHFLPRYQKGLYEHYVRLSRRLTEWAGDHGKTLVQLAVAWTLRNPVVISTLIGAKSPDQVRSMVGADEWRLTAAELAEIESIVDSLPQGAKDAKMIVWDHFSPEALEGLRKHRYEPLGGEKSEKA
jgi:aryl-alcohol dehydrogenase-like predicted oxidoreductase